MRSTLAIAAVAARLPGFLPLSISPQVALANPAATTGTPCRAWSQSVYTPMRFEWDERKRQDNIRKHGIDFVDAALIFEGPILESTDTRRAYGETRWRALGRSGRMVLMVIYTRRGDATRIISAWKVDDDGAKRYAKRLSR